MTRVPFINCHIDSLTFSEALQLLERDLREGRKGYVVTPNAAHIVELQHNQAFRAAYREALWILPDGVSLLIASRILGQPIRERICGSDLLVPLCEVAERLGKRVFLLGGTGNSEQRALINLRRRFPALTIGAYAPPHGFERDPDQLNDIVGRIHAQRADILFVCVGAPKSEIFLHRYMPVLPCTLGLAVGSAIEYVAGTLRRAPQWVRWLGQEWLWRLMWEPKRLWRRYLIGNVIFIAVVARAVVSRWVRGAPQ